MRATGLPFRDALEHLVGSNQSTAPRQRQPEVEAKPTNPVPRVDALRALASYAAATQEWLHTRAGRPFQRWLEARGYDEATLRLNCLGGDPGVGRLPRAAGLPQHGPGVVFPCIEREEVVYVQQRSLRPDASPRWRNPAGWLVQSPRFGRLRPVESSGPGGPVVICEGMTDALSAACAGYTSVAVLGAAQPDRSTAGALVRRSGSRPLVIGFDADNRGRSGAEALFQLLAERGAGHRVSVLEVPTTYKDLNGWHQHSGRDFRGEFTSAVELTLQQERSRDR